MGEGFVEVPYKLETDGTKTFFLPACRMTKGYEIGQRGHDKERGIQDYWDALNKLAAMSEPRFRRPNENGIPGTVTCQREHREKVRIDYIEKLIEEERSKRNR